MDNFKLRDRIFKEEAQTPTSTATLTYSPDLKRSKYQKAGKEASGAPTSHREPWRSFSSNVVKIDPSVQHSRRGTINSASFRTEEAPEEAEARTRKGLKQQLNERREDAAKRKESYSSH